MVVGFGTSCLPPGIQLSSLGIGYVSGYIDTAIGGTSKRLGSLQDLLACCLVQTFGVKYVGVAWDLWYFCESGWNTHEFLSKLGDLLGKIPGGVGTETLYDGQVSYPKQLK